MKKKRNAKGVKLSRKQVKELRKKGNLDILTPQQRYIRK